MTFSEATLHVEKEYNREVEIIARKAGKVAKDMKRIKKTRHTFIYVTKNHTPLQIYVTPKHFSYVAEATLKGQKIFIPKRLTQHSVYINHFFERRKERLMIADSLEKVIEDYFFACQMEMPAREHPFKRELQKKIDDDVYSIALVDPLEAKHLMFGIEYQKDNLIVVKTFIDWESLNKKKKQLHQEAYDLYKDHLEIFPE